MSDKPRHWCFTHFDPAWDLSGLDSTKVKYLIIGVELCPTTQRWHYQCYAEFSSPQRISGAQKLLNCAGAHFESRRGTREQAREYCKKDGRFTEYGTWDTITQGKRNDIVEAQVDIKAGMDSLTLWERHPNCMAQNHRALAAYKLLVDQKNQRERGYVKKTILIFWGATGSGKTREARASSEGSCYMVTRSNTSSGSWYDGYNDEKTLIFDEFYGDWMKLADLLRITDGYEFELPTKGGMKMLKADRIIFTSNVDPEHWFRDAVPEKLAAFWRRVTEIREFRHAPEATMEGPKRTVSVGGVISDAGKRVASVAKMTEAEARALGGVPNLPVPVD